MINEVLHRLILLALVVLSLGVLRQVSLTIPPVRRAIPTGPAVGDSLPTRLKHELQRSSERSLVGASLFAFVTENCVGCQRLLSRIDGASQRDGDGKLVLVARSASDRFRRALMETGIPVVYDDSGEIWDAWSVTSTPLVVRVDENGRVSAKEVTHRVETVAGETG